MDSTYICLNYFNTPTNNYCFILIRQTYFKKFLMLIRIFHLFLSTKQKCCLTIVSSTCTIHLHSFPVKSCSETCIFSPVLNLNLTCLAIIPTRSFCSPCTCHVEENELPKDHWQEKMVRKKPAWGWNFRLKIKPS